MSEGTPDRLKAFRQQYGAQGNGKATWLGLLQLAVLAAGFAVVIALLLRPQTQGSAASEPDGAVETQRRLAVYLAEKKDADAAVAAYQKYIDIAHLALPEQAKVYYAMAKLAIDAEQYDRALPYLYHAEFLDPKSEMKDDIGKKVVLCLDKLGRNVDLRHELRDRTEIKRRAEDIGAGEKVLAEFAGEVLTDRDLEMEIEKLPAAARDTFKTPEKKFELLKNLVAQRLLLDKARRLELDKSPEIQEQLGKALDQLVVQKLIADEVRKGVAITPEDVERYYKAEPAKFTQPATAEVAIAKADSEEAAKAIAEFKDKPVAAVKGQPIPGVPKDLDTEAIFAAEPGTVAGPLKGEDGWYVFKISSKTAEKLMPFDEVRQVAERMLQAQKEQEKFQGLIDQTVQARDVTLHPERLNEGGGGPAQPPVDVIQQ